MAQNVIYANGSRDVIITAGQKIAIATIGEGDAEISYKRGNIWEHVQTLKNAQVILGTFSDARTVRIQAKEDSVYYNVGTNPGTDVWMGYAKDNSGNVTGLIGPTGSVILVVASTPTLVTGSRALTASDDGTLLECSTALTLTIHAGLSPNPSIVVIPPASGVLTIAVSGGATVNGGTASITRSRAQNPAGVVIQPYNASNTYAASGA